ncbi:hypothetical protein VNO77_27419 [Canavalia gladiata]|uniref:Uncharacterized protein n=1 Tax=Canavalia gladiata TaxID=3824 RepID=A0AAN9KWX3_CANGL
MKSFVQRWKKLCLTCYEVGSKFVPTRFTLSSPFDWKKFLTNIAFGLEPSQSTLAFQKSFLRDLLRQPHPLSLEQNLEWNSFFWRKDQLLGPFFFTSMEIGANFVERTEKKGIHGVKKREGSGKARPLHSPCPQQLMDLGRTKEILLKEEEDSRHQHLRLDLECIRKKDE